ncbi:hypothetical protein [uncultured Caulobacter sp.]|uniref:hypothetical protein n=1 Tax=uncultured Caulobacter sp. TaxID=158749 RepID=UPI0026220269|nr:hypothetical protein [uncultured Caulobacter sp.]
MKFGLLLAVGLIALFAGLANFWFGDIKLGLALIGVFVAVAGVSAWNGKKHYDARPRGEPIIE